jgi:hypothetical protein
LAGLLFGGLAASSWALSWQKRNFADLCKKLPARLVQKQRRFKQLSRFKQLPQQALSGKAASHKAASHKAP